MLKICSDYKTPSLEGKGSMHDGLQPQLRIYKISTEKEEGPQYIIHLEL